MSQYFILDNTQTDSTWKDGGGDVNNWNNLMFNNNPKELYFPQNVHF